MRMAARTKLIVVLLPYFKKEPIYEQKTSPHC